MAAVILMVRCQISRCLLAWTPAKRQVEYWFSKLRQDD